MSDLGNLLEAAMAANLENIHTAIPGTVASVNGSRVNVKPSLNRQLRDGRTEELPIVPNIPIWFPNGGGASITWPVKSGDPCVLVFSERSLDEWKGGGGTVTPADPRHHGLADAMAFVGMDPNGTPSDGIVLKMGGVTFTVSSDGVTIEGGTITHNGTDIGDTHIHSGVVAGPSNTGTPV
ncbi:MAG: putative spike protein [Prokaryotic dsDNA virus sp.]|nr:MAG: putative spike protein [Prokaryotic dsDNA virus sp.]|tara:strand:- start:2846 stop:3385 length:540 start_codon:yes stop_codon:yes gene_type:complete